MKGARPRPRPAPGPPIPGGPREEGPVWGEAGPLPYPRPPAPSPLQAWSKGGSPSPESLGRRAAALEEAQLHVVGGEML